MSNTMMSSFGGLVLFLLVTTWSAEICVEPTGFGNGVGEVDPSTIPDSVATGYTYFRFFFAGFSQDFESAVEFRQTSYAFMSVYNAIQPFEPVALDLFARVDVSNSRRLCQNFPDEATFRKYREVTLQYALGFAYKEWFFDELNNGFGSVDDFMRNAGLNPDICTTSGFDCENLSTPWGIATQVIKEISEWGESDGWNADGSYNRVVNRVPFEDWRDDPYVPSNNPWTLTNDENWQPLQENDGLGFLFNQEHVVPHIGYSGRSIYLSNQYRCSREAEEPNYDYDEEIELVIDRLANLTPELKDEIEFYDFKQISITRLLGDYWEFTKINQGSPVSYLESTEYWFSLALQKVSAYDSTLLVWREKVKYNRVRPPSLIRDRLRDVDITTYAGTDRMGVTLGTQTYPGRDFQSYIRTMPHAEYPSGSACLCEAFKEYMVALTGSDNFVNDTGTPISIALPPFGYPRREPGSAPFPPITFTYSSWSEVSDRCGQSRLNGGMHFTQSVPAAQALCAESGRIIGEAGLRILNGQVPDYVVDFENDRTITEDQCAGSGSSSSSSSSSSESSSS